MKNRPPALLVLADGTNFAGQAIGAGGDAFGEVVFNSSMTGYQEIITDPSQTGQLITFTFPHIGNCGVNPDDNETPAPKASGLICAELNAAHGQWRSAGQLENWLREYGISGICGLDTRALTLHLRKHGCQNGYISVGDLNPLLVHEKALSLVSMSGLNLAAKAGCQEQYLFADGPGPLVAVLDFGVKKSLLKLLNEAGFKVMVWPGNTTAEALMASGAAGVMLANGPGDPVPCTEFINTVKTLLGKKPIFGIGLGHHILALALGGQTSKMHVGHRGANQPVREEATGRILVTCQNHGFCVSSANLPSNVNITHVNANDGTVEGLACQELSAFSVQYHPQVVPGSTEAATLFNQFRSIIENFNRKGA